MSVALIDKGENGDVKFRTFHLASEWNCPQRIVVAYYKGKTEEIEDGPETIFYCQFAFCSPQERESNKSLGRFIALQRLLSKHPSRGRVAFRLPENAGYTALNNALKRCAINVAMKKQIRWIGGYSETDLV